ncbi:MAG TPA: S24 family peptidase [Beijerinckiaceae bacterium]|nr:S24 family peptidase [Beijerinckiaceae bacterium]
MTDADIPPGIAERIRMRLAALGKTARGASLEAGLGASTIRNVLEGRSQSPRGITLAALARVLETSEAWILHGDSSRDPPPSALPGVAATSASGARAKSATRFFDEGDRMPVYAAAEGGNGTMIVSTDEIDRIPRPYTLEGIAEAYGILITGESMVPAFRPGDTAWVNPRLPPIRDCEVILYQVNDRSGEAVATIKQLAGWTERDWLVQQWNPPKKFRLDRGVWKTCHRVVGKFSRR